MIRHVEQKFSLKVIDVVSIEVFKQLSIYPEKVINPRINWTVSSLPYHRLSATTVSK
jgi:hypothetical protein